MQVGKQRITLKVGAKALREVHLIAVSGQYVLLDFCQGTMIFIYFKIALEVFD